MPKMKTRRAAHKRFKATASGKLKFKVTRLRHKLSNKSSDVKRKKGNPDYVKSVDMSRLNCCLPHGIA